MSKKKIIILIIILIVVVPFIRYIIVERRKNYEKTIKIHAETIIHTYLNQWRMAIINGDDEVKKCYQVNEEYSGETYFGSVYISDDEGYIWLKVENYWIASNSNWTKIYPKEDTMPKLIFTCDKTGKYLIYLKQGNKLYLKT